MPSPILTQCRQTADAVEAGAAQLGPSWSGYGPLNALCAHFRRSAEELAENRGLSEITVAFVGPKKAGKSTLLGLFIRPEEKRRLLKAGRSVEESTEKPTWIGPEPPES